MINSISALELFVNSLEKRLKTVEVIVEQLEKTSKENTINFSQLIKSINERLTQCQKEVDELYQDAQCSEGGAQE